MWYTSRFVENFQELGLYFNSIEQVNSNEQCDSIDLTEPEKIEILNTFAKDIINVLAILLRELVSSVDITSILEIWEYNNEKQIETKSQTRQQPFIIGLGDSIKVKTLVHIEQSFPDMSFCLPNISYNNVYNKINYQRSYITVKGLTKKAIQPGLDASSSAIQELKDFMNKFITKYIPKKRERMNTIQLEDENEVNSSSDEENIIAIENPSVHSKRGAPRKKRLKGHMN
ncbi:hypothetical protein F8M41_020524 [Gigaspora margarita]|uniref:Uncharacterized protein n=1 Tax=Gigaspora margarita TaxID=4874 RepID=A0A8H4AIC8_GIGMA|nr:hypothetical protein F8M41_020524 [Gigaspora margarita]